MTFDYQSSWRSLDFFFFPKWSFIPHSTRSTPTWCGTIQMPRPCLLWVFGSERLAVQDVKGSRVSGSVWALWGRRELAQVFSPRYVNPTAAKRAGTTQRRAGGRKEETDRRTERERRGCLQPTMDGSTQFSQVAATHMCATGWEPGTCIAKVFHFE